jgi:ribosomal protein S18 acetylase RimI-like enzyme
LPSQSSIAGAGPIGTSLLWTAPPRGAKARSDSFRKGKYDRRKTGVVNAWGRDSAIFRNSEQKREAEVSGPRTFPVLLDGYTDLPPGKIANVVTFFEWSGTAAPPARRADFEVRAVERPSVPWFRGLYREIGERWLWFSAAVTPDDKLSAMIGDPEAEILAISRAGRDVGMAQLDFGKAGEAEIVTFGVVEAAIGTGAAYHLMEHTLARASARGVDRVWLHTCTFDHPNAIGFYQRCGFTAWKFAIEVSDDPRATGALPESAGPHVPFLGRR